MFFTILADTIVAIHFLFICFAVFGALLSFIRIKWSLLHIPALLWAICIELFGWICPLTPLENRLRQHAAGAGYQTGFIEHYLEPIIYPAGLTRDLQVILGILLLACNVFIYVLVFRRHHKTKRPPLS